MPRARLLRQGLQLLKRVAAPATKNVPKKLSHKAPPGVVKPPTRGSKTNTFTNPKNGRIAKEANAAKRSMIDAGVSPKRANELATRGSKMRSKDALNSVQRREARKGNTKARYTKQQPKPQGANGKRAFTPTNRAKAVQRANERQARSEGYTLSDGSNVRTISSGGMASRSMKTRRVDEAASRMTNTGNPATAKSKRRVNSNNDIEFRPTYPKNELSAYNSASENGRSVKRSKIYNKTRTANIEDQLGHQLDRTKKGDYVTAHPLTDVNKKTGELKNTSSRARYYKSKSNGALSSTKYTDPTDKSTQFEVRARRGPHNKWENSANAKKLPSGKQVPRTVEFDPKDLRKPLADLAKDTPRSLLGQRAGGNSRLKIRVGQGERIPNANPPVGRSTQGSSDAVSARGTSSRATPSQRSAAQQGQQAQSARQQNAHRVNESLDTRQRQDRRLRRGR